MLPFIKKSTNPGVISKPVSPDDYQEPKELNEDDGLEMAAQDILTAIEHRDYKALAAAIRAAFEIVDAEPHFEADHLED